jgi:Cu-Zn family superoxide dismutase
MRKLIALTAAMMSMGLVIGCEGPSASTNATTQSTTEASTNPAHTATAVAEIAPAKAASTQPSEGNTTGSVTFTQTGQDQVKVVVDLKGLPPGEHGFHIHEKGDLSAPDLSSAGGHFNPMHHEHGAPTAAQHHAGDLGNITADADGTVKKEITVEGLSIGTGKPDDIIGKAVIVHEKPDDLKSQPSGAAGARIAGGVIEEKS